MRIFEIVWCGEIYITLSIDLMQRFLRYAQYERKCHILNFWIALISTNVLVGSC